MASTINALTTGVGGIQSTGDTSGEISLQSNGSTVLAMTASGVAVTGTMTVGGNAVLKAGTTVTVPQGGTGLTAATTGDLLVGSGTNTLTNLAIGANNTVLTSNGTTATWAAAGGGQFQTQIFTAPGTWTKPSSCTQVRVIVVGGGGGSAGSTSLGGTGGFAIAANVPVSAPVTVTVGAGGSSPGGPGGTSSFGPAVSATGGNGGGSSPGTGTVSIGTALRTSNISETGNSTGSLGLITGPYRVSPPFASPTPYSTSSSYMAGAGGNYSAPVGPSNAAGIGGVVLVEFVG